jgi:hypothetical protein
MHNFRTADGAHRLIPISDRAQWEDALAGVPHAFAHTWQSCNAMSLTTDVPTYLYVYESGASRIVCPISERTFEGQTDVYTPYGFSGFTGDGDWDAMLRNWRAFARERDYVCGYFGMNPLLTQPARFDLQEVFEYNDLYVLKLGQSDEALFAALSDNRKRQLRSLAREPLIFDIDPAMSRAFLMERMNQFYELKGAGAAYRFSAATLEALLDPMHGLVVGAGDRDGREVHAASLFVFTPYIAEYFAGISIQQGRVHSAALLWRGAMELKRRGLPLLNLGGGVTRNDGIADFKERFGATKVPLYALKQVYRGDAYRQLCLRAGADPGDRTGFFPPYYKTRGSGDVARAQPE